MKFKKILFLLLFVSLTSNMLYPVSVFAQTTTDNAAIQEDNTLPINPSPQVSQTPTDTLIPQLSLTGVQTSQNKLRTSPVVQKLAKKYYRSDENVHVAINNTQNDSFHVSILDPKGQKADVSIQQVTDTTDQVAFDIAPRVEFHPGKYTLQLTDKYGETSKQDFTWGILAINMDRSIYTPGQTANIAMAVLDEQGNMVCDANLELSIKNNELGIADVLSTENKQITVNQQCESHNFSLKPDYEANYVVKKSGTYTMTLTAQTKNGSYSISDKIIVNDTVPFDVQRISATRIYPPNNYPVQLNVTANQDFTGTITETVPQDFTITASSQTNSYDNLQTVYLNSQKDPVNQLAKQVTDLSNQNAQVLGASTSAGTNPMSAAESTLVLPFTGSYPITEGFGAEQTDPPLKAFYQKYGLAGHDGIDFGLPVGTSIRAVDDGNIVLAGTGDYGITIVIQHSWGKSYYGHLSKVLVGTNQHVTKGQEIALSGDTGEATGPHLHFGMKPNIPDMLNGYFGKVDPLPYFHLPPNASIALGAATQIASAVSNEQVLGASTSAKPVEVLSAPQAVTDTSVAINTTTLTKQVRSQLLDMSATPVNNKVKVLSWHVSLKKGDKVSLGYTFKAPLVSPQFYLLGPLTFYPEGDTKQPVFQEQRQWQIAADAVGTAWYDYNWQYRKQITIDHMKINMPTLENEDSFNQPTSNHTATVSHTVGTKNNRLLVVAVNNSGALNTVATVTYGAASLTKLSSVSVGSVGDEELWYLVAPASGTANVVVTLTGSNTAAMDVGVASFYDVNQTTPLGTPHANSSASNQTSASNTIVTVDNQLVIDSFWTSNGSSDTFVPGTGQTQFWSSMAFGTGSYKNATSTSTTMSWTFSSDSWEDIGVGINPVDLTNFPVLVNLSSDSDLAANAQNPSGNDILFTDSTGQTKLNHEIEKYTAGTGELEAWINVPAVSATTDTILYMYYGNAAAANQQNASAVWDSNYLAVYHLGQTPPTSGIIDSTTHANSGTTTNMVSGDAIAGQIDGALNFNTNKFINLGTAVTVKGSTQYTVSAWFNVTAFTAANKMQIYSECTQTSGTTRVNFGLTQASPGQLTLNGRVADADGLTTFVTNSTTLSTATWYYASAVFDSTTANNNMHLMLNGIDQTASLSKGTIANTTPGGATEIGAHCAQTAENWNGKIDELRLSNTARNPGWNATEYLNMNSPSTFYTLGTVETKLYAPTLDQLMRGGKWFCPTTSINGGTACLSNPGEQPFTF